MAETALLEASQHGDDATVRALLAVGGVDVNTSSGWNNRTPLHLASQKGHVQVIELLLAAGASVHVEDLDGFTPLMLAAHNNRPLALERLLQLDADVAAATKNGRTALHLAAMRGHADIVAQLLNAPQADPNIVVQNQNGHTPLHVACIYRRNECARVLLQLGADLHAKDADGYTPFHHCVLHRKATTLADTLATLQVLVSCGATWDATCDEILRAGKARKDAAALRVCVSLWAQEHTDGLPLTSIPVDNVRRGPEDTRIYIDELKQSKEVKHRRKICVVGPSKAGKTSLIKSLTSKKPSLEHPDDRTIGIDQIQLRFGVQEHGKSKIHEVTFWDFAGQNEYHVAHSLFFSARTLYLVCVDLEAFLVAFMQADLMAHTNAQREQLLNEFIERDILRWVRTIFSQQPDAEFVFVATKDDMLHESPRFTDTVKTSLRSKLSLVEGIMVEMQRELRKRDEHDGERSALTLTLHAFQKRLGWRQDRELVNAGDNEPVETKLDTTTAAASLRTRFFNFVSSVTANPSVADESTTSFVHSPSTPNDRAPTWDTLFVSCADIGSVRSAREAITDLIVQSRRSYEMPDSYTDVLGAVIAMREATAVGGTDARVSQAFAPIESLVRSLLTKASGEIDAATCRSILQTLHDLGDVLWYEDLGVELFRETVILDPLLLIDFVRQVINHHHLSEMLAHGELQGLPFWRNVRDQQQVLALKQVLETFQLVHPSDGAMKWNSDLIVPAFWKSKTPAAWLFGYEDVRLAADVRNDDPNRPAEIVRVHWQYQFTHEFPDTLFDHLVVATYSPFMERDAGPDWVLYAEDQVFACRAMVARNAKTQQRVLHLEAVLAESAPDDSTNELWEAFDCLSEGIVKVLRRYPGLVFSSVALDKEGKMRDLESLFGFPIRQKARAWMPRDESWDAYKKMVRGTVLREAL